LIVYHRKFSSTCRRRSKKSLLITAPPFDEEKLEELIDIGDATRYYDEA